MGIFTNALNEAYGENVYYNAEADLYDGDFTEEQAIGMDESFDLNFAEQGLYAVAEINQFYHNTMKQIGIAELAYFEANGKEMVYEAVDLSSLGEKIKNIFKKIIEKVKHLFHMFIARLGKMFSDNKSFVNKYRNEFIKKWSEVGSGATIKGFKFTVKDGEISTAKDTAVDTYVTNKTSKMGHEKVSGADTNLANVSDNGNGGKDYAGANANLDTVNRNYSDNKDTNRENIRKDVAVEIAKFFDGATAPTSGLSDKEFTEWVYEACRNGESTKQDIEIKSFDTSEILNKVSEFSKVKSAVTRISTRLTTAANKTSRDFERKIKEYTNNAKGKTGEEGKFHTNFVALLSHQASAAQNWFDDQIKAASIVATAIKDRTSQYKSIMVRVIGGGKKVTREGYEFDDNNTSVNEAKSILDRVTIF